MNRYKVTGARAVHDHEPGTEFDYDYTAAEENDLLDSGRLEIVPAAYRVTGTRPVHDTPPGGVFTAAFTVGQLHALFEAGHIEVAPQRKSKAAVAAETREV